jgi:hypothetical protein
MPARGRPDIASMAALLFTCPITRMKVQHWLDDDEDASEDDYEGAPAKLALACTSSTGRARCWAAMTSSAPCAGYSCDPGSGESSGPGTYSAHSAGQLMFGCELPLTGGKNPVPNSKRAGLRDKAQQG